MIRATLPRSALQIAAVLAALYLLGLATLFAAQRQLVFYPTQRAPSPAEAGFADATDQALVAADGTKIRLWYAPAQPGQPTILYFQGKGGEIADRPLRWAAYRAAGLGTAFLSYRGYGASQGTPSEDGFHQDADAARDWLMAQGVAPDRLIVVGESLGTGVAVRLAADRPVGALILEAPYTSLADLAARRFPFVPARWLIRDPFPSLDRIPRVTAPLMILHGTADTRVPTQMGRDLYDAAKSQKEFIPFPGIGHVDLFGPDLWARELAFIARHLPPLPAP